MNQDTAQQIADLINRRSRLNIRLNANSILRDADQYIVESAPDGVIMGCAKVKPVSWYQSELLHLCVSEAYEGRGVGSRLIAAQIAKAKAAGTSIAQCTVVDDGAASLHMLEKNGFVTTQKFRNPSNGRVIRVLQLSLNPT